MRSLSLPERYEAIIIPAGSFHLIERREESLGTLKRFREHLVPGGRLILDLGLQTDFRVGTISTGTVETPQGETITMEAKVVEVDFLEQYSVSYLRYEKWRDGELLRKEMQRFAGRWYGLEEFDLVLMWHLAPYYRSAREVGGDFYDFHLLSGGKLGLAVGDATGKGVPAALVMSTTCGMLRLAAQSLSSPGELLQRVNEALFPNIPPNMFVTCFYVVLDPKSGSLTYANAGHDLPYVHRGGNAEELRARGMPLGLMPSTSYEEKEISLDAGEAAFFYTDGLVEAHNPQGEMFGFPRLRALISEHDEERRLEGFLLEELNSFVGEGWEQEDDITLLTLRCSK